MNERDQAVAEANLAAWSKASEWGRSPRMTEFEAFMWRSERHPQQSSTILSVMVLDTTPDWDRLMAAHEWGTELIARTRQRVLEPALPVGLFNALRAVSQSVEAKSGSGHRSRLCEPLSGQ